MEKIIRNVKTNPGGTIFNRTRQCLAYADDVVILGATCWILVYIWDIRGYGSIGNGLSVNNAKTKCMVNREGIKTEPKEI
jgi:hypothetical protein